MPGEASLLYSSTAKRIREMRATIAEPVPVPQLSIEHEQQDDCHSDQHRGHRQSLDGEFNRERQAA
jgi:hypothetical protein